MKILGNRVLVKVEKLKEETNKYGFIIPVENTNEIFLTGKIIELGNTVTVETLIDASNKGQKILFMKEDSKKILEMKEYELYLVELCFNKKAL